MPCNFEPEHQPAQRFTYASGARPLEGYTIKRGVGRGGFGEVYFAVSDAGKEVALKHVRHQLDVELRGVKQCLNLKHQNLVALYDMRQDAQGDHWVVMEYVSGESLEQAIDRHPAGLPEPLLRHWLTGLVAGVAYLHDQGIVHRDLKPANVFLDAGVVKIGDYGLSKFIAGSRRSGQTESVGTVHYMAPEIANGRYGKEIDTYAVGVMLYEMLTGQVPFQGESVGEVLMKHLTAQPDLTPLAAPYRGLVQQALAKDPQVRLSRVDELLNQLPPAANGATSSRETGTPPAPGASFPSSDGTAAESPPVSEEPIAAALQRTGRWLLEEVQPLPPLTKAIAACLLVATGLFSMRLWIMWLPWVFLLLFVYLTYRVLRAIVCPAATAAEPAAPADQPTVVPPAGAAQQQPQHARRRRQTWQRQLLEHVAARPLRGRVTELCGSLLVAAFIASMLAILGCMLVNQQFALAPYLWLAMVITGGSWAVMIPAKLTEGHLEDHTPLRCGMMVAGAVLGLWAWGLADALVLQFFVSPDDAVLPAETFTANVLGVTTDANIVQQFQQGAVPLPLSVATAYFAFLFVLLRWWRLAEYARPARVSLWSMLVCAGTGYLLTWVWWFPQPLGAVLAASMAFAVQLASPWMPPSRRRALAETGA